MGIFVSKSFSKVTVRNQVIFNTFEYIDLEILSKNKVIRLITLYRPPTIDGKRKEKEFIEEFGNYLDTINNLRTTFICGDFNLWLDKVSECNYVGEFVELLEAHSLVNSVIKPTTKSEHIIDLVTHTKDHKLIKNVEVEPECTTSPFHRLITYRVDVRRSDVLWKKIIWRDKTGFNAEKFIEDSTVKIRSEEVRCECTPNVLSGNHNPCVNCYVRKSKEVFSVIYSEKCPIVEKQIVISDNPKWFNKELSEAKRKRRKFEDKWKRAKNRESRALYNKARNDYNTLIEKTKRNYYNNALKNNKDPRMFSKNLDDLIGLKKEKVLPENNNNHIDLASKFVNFFMIKQIKYIGVLRTKIPQIYHLCPNK